MYTNDDIVPRNPSHPRTPCFFHMVVFCIYAIYSHQAQYMWERHQLAQISVCLLGLCYMQVRGDDSCTPLPEGYQITNCHPDFNGLTFRKAPDTLFESDLRPAHSHYISVNHFYVMYVSRFHTNRDQESNNPYWQITTLDKSLMMSYDISESNTFEKSREEKWIIFCDQNRAMAYERTTVDDALAACHCQYGHRHVDSDPNSACEPCPSNSDTHNSGSEESDECVCNPGFFKNMESGECISCMIGHYMQDPRNVTCTQCPLNSTSTTPPSNVCVCNDSYTGPNGNAPCRQCSTTEVPSRESEEHFVFTNTICNTHLDNIIFSQLMYNVSEMLLQKHMPPQAYAHRYESPNSDYVIMKDSAYWSVKIKKYLSTGKFRRYETTGVFGGVHESDRLTFPASSNWTWFEICDNQVHKSDVRIELTGTCECGPGSTGTGKGGCMMCDPGLFKAYIGNTTCVECDAGTFSHQQASVCVDCVAGTYSESAASATCISCPSPQTSPSKSNTTTACVCMSGWQGGENELCTICAAGKYKELIGDAPCNECMSKQASTDVGQTTCPQCSVAGVACGQCPVGTRRLGHECIYCDLNTYKSRVETYECEQCQDNSITTSSGSTLPTDCNCIEGFFLSSSDTTTLQCTPCAPGHYRNSTFAPGTTCVPCPAGYYAERVQQRQCCPCPCNFVSVHAQYCAPCAFNSTRGNNNTCVKASTLPIAACSSAQIRSLPLFVRVDVA